MTRDQKGMGSKLPSVEKTSDIHDICGQAKKRHVTDIFTFLPRLVHSYRDKPIGRWDYRGKTT